MGKQEIEDLNAEWKECMDWDFDNPPPPYLLYEPFSEQYWNEEYKIVFCNLETYADDKDFENEGHIFSIKDYKRWLEYNTPTPKNTGLFLSCLYNRLHDIECLVTETELSALYYDNDRILETVNKTLYMNLRKEIGTGSKEDTRAIHEFLDPKYTRYKNDDYISLTKDFIYETEAKIFIVAGKTGAEIIKAMYGEDLPLEYQGKHLEKDGTLFFSIKHPAARDFSYEYDILEKCKKITEIVKSNDSKTKKNKVFK